MREVHHSTTQNASQNASQMLKSSGIKTGRIKLDGETYKKYNSF